MKQTFEIINPSDPYTITGEPASAAAATLFLGEGQYALRDAANESVLPLCLFGGHEKAMADLGVPDFDAWLSDPDNLESVAEALDTVRLGRDKRSSLNNIGARAKELADALRVTVAERRAAKRTK